MDVIVNGQTRVVPDGSTLHDLLETLGVAADAVATAVNGEFVARPRRDGCVLQAQDRITCIQPITGG